MTKLYTQEDLRRAEKSYRRCLLLLAAVLAPLLAGYVLALARGSYALSLALALTMLAWILFSGDLLLLPRRRYRAFLRELKCGLRRQTSCSILRLEDEIQVQDGANVRLLRVVLPQGEERIFYLNAAKADCLPTPGAGCTLVSCGRHVVEFTQD